MRWLPAALLVLLSLIASAILLLSVPPEARGQLVIEPGGTHWWKPGRVRTGPTHFVNLGTDNANAGEGTIVFCDDCLPTNPAQQGTLGVDGSVCRREREAGVLVWNCGGGTLTFMCPEGTFVVGFATDGPVCAPIQCTPLTCPPGQVVVGQDDMCGPLCGPPITPNACPEDEVATDIESDGQLSCSPLCSTTTTIVTTTTTVTGSTTTTTTSSTTTTTLVLSEACITVDGLNSGDDLYHFYNPPTTGTLVQIGCSCSGTCSTLPAIQLVDGVGNVVSTIGTMACSTGSANTTKVFVNPADLDKNLGVGEGIGFSVTNSPTAVDPPDRITICVGFTRP